MFAIAARASFRPQSVSLFWEALEILRGRLSGGRALPHEFFADERVSWHRLTPEKRNGPSSGELEAVMELADTLPGEVFSCDRDR
jgi:hypothetical protein